MIKEKLDKLRKILKENRFGGYMVSTKDEYLSEYTPEYAKRLEYITGFTGSNGLAIILQDTILFFTDGRYINQCSSQLDSKLFEIFDLQLLHNFQWSRYFKDDEAIYYDPKLFTNRDLQNFFPIKLKPHKQNLIDQIWCNQPPKPSSDIYDYPLEYAGEKYEAKIEKCRKILFKNSANSLVITDPDSICWLLNIRAHDVEFSPLLLAYLVISNDKIHLFVDKDRVNASLRRENLFISPEKEFSNFIANIKGVILFDDRQSSVYVCDLIKSKKHKTIENPCILWKSCKNDVEIKHMQQRHIQDAVAVCEMLAFIDNHDVSDLTEYDIGKKLTEFRAKNDGYVFDSFPTICGYQENGAVIHYRAEKDKAKKITNDGLLLIDSGGQYLGATTDITRTIAIGEPKSEYKKYYTKVLKGHIALGNAVFPKDKVSGAHLDILARQYLWNGGADYVHGTGHGVGSFLSVHEGPQNISPYGFSTILQKNMVLSNEPGYYVPGEFGIRIENMMYVKALSEKGCLSGGFRSSKQDFLCFQMLTLVPYAKELIELDMLSISEKRYLESYYCEIDQKVTPLLSASAKSWLKDQISLSLIRV